MCSTVAIQIDISTKKYNLSILLTAVYHIFYLLSIGKSILPLKILPFYDIIKKTNGGDWYEFYGNSGDEAVLQEL